MLRIPHIIRTIDSGQAATKSTGRAEIKNRGWTSKMPTATAASPATTFQSMQKRPMRMRLDATIAR